jgi:hypothetical protein
MTTRSCPINDPSAVAMGWAGSFASPTDPNLYKVQPAVFAKLQADLGTHMSSRAGRAVLHLLCVTLQPRSLRPGELRTRTIRRVPAPRSMEVIDPMP